MIFYYKYVPDIVSCILIHSSGNSFEDQDLVSY